MKNYIGILFCVLFVNVLLLTWKSQDTCFIRMKEKTSRTGLNMNTIMNSQLQRLSKTDFIDTEASFANKTLVILKSVIRSGSTMTGQIIQQSNKVFYVYEPGHSTQILLNGPDSTTSLEGETIFINDTTYKNRTMAIIEGYLTCQFRNLDFKTLVDKFQLLGRRTRTFFNCQKMMEKFYGSRNATLICLDILRRDCLNSDVRVVKAVRISTIDLEIFMKKYPTLKIIHLMRDPRAVLRSAGDVGWDIKNRSFLNTVSSRICGMMLRSTKISSKLLRTYKNRIKILFYETMASDPVSTSKHLYDFLGINFTTQIRNYVHNITSMGEDVCQGICFKQGNSSSHVNSWRHQLNISQIRMIDKNCRNVYEAVGYKSIRDENELFDISSKVFDSKTNLCNTSCL